MEVVVSRLKGARLKIEENFTHDNFSGNSVPRDSSLKSRKFLELDSNLRDQRPLGQPCLRVNLMRLCTQEWKGCLTLGGRQEETRS